MYNNIVRRESSEKWVLSSLSLPRPTHRRHTQKTHTEDTTKALPVTLLLISHGTFITYAPSEEGRKSHVQPSIHLISVNDYTIRKGTNRHNERGREARREAPKRPMCRRVPRSCMAHAWNAWRADLIFIVCALWLFLVRRNGEIVLSSKERGKRKEKDVGYSSGYRFDSSLCPPLREKAKKQANNKSHIFTFYPWNVM